MNDEDIWQMEFADLRGLVQQHRPWSTRQRNRLWQLASWAHEIAPERYAEEWAPYLSQAEHHWVEPFDVLSGGDAGALRERLRRATALFPWATWEVNLTGAPGHGMGAWMDDEAARKVTRLAIGQKIDEWDLQQLADATALTGVTYFECVLEASTLAALDDGFELSSLPSLVEVYLGVDNLRDQDIEALARSPLLSVPTHLGIDGTLTASGLAALGSAPGAEHVHGLSLQLGRLPAGAVEAMVHAPHLTNLRALYLEWNEVGDDALEQLARAPSMANLEVLLLEECGITDLTALAESPYMACLRELNLRKNHFADVDVIALVRSEYMANLEVLQLGYNYMRPVSAVALAESEHMSNLQRLNLEDCFIQDEGVRALAASPHLSNLVSLDLRKCGFRDEGALALAQSPHLRRLERLHLGENHYGLEARQALAQSEYLSDEVKRFFRR